MTSKNNDGNFVDLMNSSYGSVYKALHKESGQVLAIKQVPVDTDLQEIIKEISIMQQCDSPFIVKYYGSYFKNTDLWVSIMAWQRLCSLCLTTVDVPVVPVMQLWMLMQICFLTAYNLVFSMFRNWNSISILTYFFDF